MAASVPADDGDIRIEEDDVLDNGSDLMTASEDPVSFSVNYYKLQKHHVL
ncbi:unnamed protein product [Gongylonema pulchrum]|uniref:RNA polymerase sigma factor RpoS n=1 Tax=Gongylonema pulchrum TaxID=637853 RepID=A0A183EIX5_9BILA|nr:unnamed protein product [Gongylonema pulchrum]